MSQQHLKTKEELTEIALEAMTSCTVSGGPAVQGNFKANKRIFCEHLVEAVGSNKQLFATHQNLRNSLSILVGYFVNQSSFIKKYVEQNLDEQRSALRQDMDAALNALKEQAKLAAHGEKVYDVQYVDWDNLVEPGFLEIAGLSKIKTTPASPARV